MMLARVLVLALATTVPLSTGCLVEEPGVAEQEMAEIGFEELDVSKHSAPAGLTVLKTGADFTAFFGETPPESVDFKRHWVVHLSAGVKNTGGYRIEIVRIEKRGTGSNRQLVVLGHESAPGPDCFVTQAFTNPQVTVRINKQPSTPKSALELDAEVRSCGQGSCEELGGECKSSPTDVTFPADCQQDYAMQKVVGAECPAINQACCLPVRCGGIAARPCPAGATCVDDPHDDCDPENGGADCGGICVPEPACDPTLMCTQVITCVAGKLYPTGCGPANCDESIGDC